MGKFTRVISVSLFNVIIITVSYILAEVVGMVFTAIFSGFLLGIASSDVLECLVGDIITILLAILSTIAILLTINPASNVLTQHLTYLLLILPILVISSHTIVYLIFRRLAYR